MHAHRQRGDDEHRHHTRRNSCNLPIMRAVRYPRWYVSVCACVTRAYCACGHGRLAGCVGGSCVRVCAPQIMPVESYVAMELAALRLNMTSGLVDMLMLVGVAVDNAKVLLYLGQRGLASKGRRRRRLLVRGRGLTRGPLRVRCAR
jgi:hypothetical protein